MKRRFRDAWPYRAAALLLLVAVLGGFAYRKHTEPTRWALVVGISDYVYYGDEPGGDLPGAANDARNIHEVLLKRWGFRESNVKLLLNHDATRAAIEHGLTQWLPSVVKPGDLVIFYFAGHGSQAFDTDGDEQDGLDETICPTDVMRKDSSKDIVDDELGEWLRAIPTEHVKVILDSCHSGSATRAFTLHARARSLGRTPTTDLTPPPGWTPPVQTRSLTGGANAPKATRMAATHYAKVLELAAAQPHEVAMETIFENPSGQGLPRAGGAFTTMLVRNLWQVPTTTTYEEVFRLTANDMRKQGFTQRPQITGDARGQALFAQSALASAAPPAIAQGLPPQQPAAPVAAPTPAAQAEAAAATAGHVPVTAVMPGNRVRLGGGRNAGIVEGSLYQVGRHVLRITQVQDASAVAEEVTALTRNIRVTGGAITVGAPARLVAHRFDPATLTVSVAELPGAVQAAVRNALGSERGFALRADRQQYAQLIVRPDGRRHLLLSSDGGLRHTIDAATPAALAAALVPLLRQERAAREIAVLDNPAYPFKLDLAFEGAKTDFRLGETLSFRVRTERDGYLTIVDVATDGVVTLLFPNQYEQDNRVRAGQELVIPTPAMGFELSAGEPVGRGIVRAFLTETPMNVPFPTRDGFGQADASQAGTIAAALRRAAGEAPLPGTDLMPVHSWATAAVVYEIAGN
jgi:hypothetical protein